MNSGLPINSTFDLDDETSENHHDYENDQEITERSAKRAKVDRKDGIPVHALLYTVVVNQ